MKIHQKLYLNIRTNYDIYLTLIAAIVVAFLGALDKTKIETVGSAILGILALVAFNILKSRRENDKIKKLILQLDGKIALSDRFLKQYFDDQEFKKTLERAKSAFFCGITFTRTLHSLDKSIRTSLQNGSEIFFLLIKPDSTSIEMAAFRNLNRKTKERVNSTLKETLLRLKDIYKTATQYAGKLEVRYINYLVPYTIIGIMPNNSNGLLFVRLTSFRILDEERPTFELDAIEDEKWFDFYKNQFNEIWINAEQVNFEEID